MKKGKVMRFKKVAITILLCLVFTGTAHAASFVANVVEVGSASAVYIRLTETTAGGFTNRWFQCTDANIQNRILAVALTAQSLGKPARVQITSSAEWSQITGIYMMAE